jgi:hypothetical protein
MTILTGSNVGEPRAASAPRALWAGLRRLQKMPHPLWSKDESEREKAKDEWRREIPSIIEDLFDEVREALGDEQARSLFKQAVKRDRHRPQNRGFKMLALDHYDALERRGDIPSHQLVKHTAAILSRYFPMKLEESIASEIRRFLRERSGRKNGQN